MEGVSVETVARNMGKHFRRIFNRNSTNEIKKMLSGDIKVSEVQCGMFKDQNQGERRNKLATVLCRRESLRSQMGLCAVFVL
jgi:hypothetical protein